MVVNFFSFICSFSFRAALCRLSVQVNGFTGYPDLILSWTVDSLELLRYELTSSPSLVSTPYRAAILGR